MMPNRAMSRHVLVCLLLCGCRVEKDRSAVPARTAWVVNDDDRTSAGAPMFTLSRDGAFSVEPGQTAARPRIVLTCTAGSPVIVQLVLPRAFVPSTPANPDSVQVRWRTDEASPMHTESWRVVAPAGDTLASVQSPPGVALQLRSARTITVAFVHAPRREELSFELGGLRDNLTRAAATCRLDPATLAPLASATAPADTSTTRRR